MKRQITEEQAAQYKELGYPVAIERTTTYWIEVPEGTKSNYQPKPSILQNDKVTLASPHGRQRPRGIIGEMYTVALIYMNHGPVLKKDLSHELIKKLERKYSHKQISNSIGNLIRTGFVVKYTGGE